MTEIIERFTHGIAEKILSHVSSSYQEVENAYQGGEDRTYVFVIDDVSVVLMIHSSSLQLKTFFRGNYLLNEANEWNETKRFTRCHIESDGSIVLVADYSLLGGVTLINVVIFFVFF